jgi:hypothetical protein
VIHFLKVIVDVGLAPLLQKDQKRDLIRMTLLKKGVLNSWGTFVILAVAAISTSFISLSFLKNGTLHYDLTGMFRLLVLALSMFDTVCPELSWNHTTEPLYFKSRVRTTGTVSSK